MDIEPIWIIMGGIMSIIYIIVSISLTGIGQGINEHEILRYIVVGALVLIVVGVFGLLELFSRES